VKYFNVFRPNEDHKGDMRSLVNKGPTSRSSPPAAGQLSGATAEFKDGEQKRDFSM